MALENLSVKELKKISPSNLGKEVSKMHEEIETDANGKSVLPQKYCAHWDQLKIFLTLAKMFTPKKVDKMIDAVIVAGDFSCGGDDDEDDDDN